MKKYASIILNRSKMVWARFWMRSAGLSYKGRFALRLATYFSPSYKGRTYLSHLTDRSYVSPTALIAHNDLLIDQNVFIGDRVVIYQARNGGAVNIGKMSHVHQDSIIETGEGGRLIIGADTHIQPRCQFSAYKGSIEIGSYVQIAPNCVFYPYNHTFLPNRLIKKQPLKTKGGIVIGDDAWLGVGVIVLDGVKIGKGSVVGAGSVVNQNVPDGAIVAGNPAQIKKYRRELND